MDTILVIMHWSSVDIDHQTEVAVQLINMIDSSNVHSPSLTVNSQASENSSW